MELRYTLFAAFMSLGLFSQAQGLVTITNEDGATVNGTLITGSCLYSTDTVSLLTAINGEASRTVNVRRYELWPVPMSKNFFCWGVCYLPVLSGVNLTWVSQHPVDMNPGATYDNFHSYYQPQGQSGTARFRYVWYDTANPAGADSSWVDIQYCGQVGVEERTASSTALTAWPMPSLGQDVQVEYTLDRSAQGSQLVVYSILGDQVKRMNLSGVQGRIVLSTADLGAGVYFANIERQGRVLATRKLIVAR